ncbi:YitT family protein [Amnibacterium endophyticum]|uniref:YitT family protein n=1 Tax=Amnibacterium endophyticum TaxID=2109337 RepID=A0ABW4LCH9_9MICO
MTRTREHGAPARPLAHSRLEDVVAILLGTYVASFGVFLLHSSGAVTGGTAGLALLLGYALHLPFGAVYAVLNLPFLALAARTRGVAFAARTAICIGLIAAWAFLHPVAAPGLSLPPLYGALTGDLLIGIAMLMLFRHNASLGGLNTLALLAQDRFGVSAGRVQLALDATIVLLSLLVVPWPLVLVSAAGAALLNLVLVMNHRPGRYLAA